MSIQIFYIGIDIIGFVIAISTVQPQSNWSKIINEINELTKLKKMQ